MALDWPQNPWFLSAGFFRADRPAEYDHFIGKAMDFHDQWRF